MALSLAVGDMLSVFCSTLLLMLTGLVRNQANVF